MDLPSAATKPAHLPPPPPAMELLSVLEYAAQSIKHLSSSSSSSSEALASLRTAHQAIGAFLDRFDPRLPDAEMSDRTEREDCEAEMLRAGVDEVENGMRECDLQSKRPRKRGVPTSWPRGRAFEGDVIDVDLIGRRRAASMDLIYQFHG